MTVQQAPYVATIEIQIWEWEHEKATTVFKNLCDDIAHLSHRTVGGSHALQPPTSMLLRPNPNYERAE